LFSGACGFESHPGHLGDIAIRLQPRAKREEVVGERAGAVVIRVTAPPVDGKANAALCTLVAKAAGVASSHVEVVRGHTSRDKVVRVSGLTDQDLRAALLG
jgi:uncharacterized protein (TIGR00251 family)